MNSTLIKLPPKPAVSLEAVQDQLQRILASPLFKNSRRYPKFLSYVVDEALSGHQDQLKERSIGIYVFRRAPAYDLNIDPVVRVTAGEVRKRLAQYYYVPEHQDELRIELKPGSYVPEFKLMPERGRGAGETYVETLRSEATEALENAAAFSAVAVTESNQPVSVGIGNRAEVGTASSETQRRVQVSLLLILLALVAAGGLIAFFARTPSAVDTFWQPVWKSNSPVLISVGSWDPPRSEASDVSIGRHAKYSDPIALSDTITIARIQQLLSQHAKPSQIQSSTQTTFADIQRGTTVLISGFDNPWTMRLTEPLRFHFVAKTPDLLAIEDRNHPERNDWLIDTRTAYVQLSHDFGIVARFYDPTTEQNIVVAAGIGEDGTIAAGQMLTNADALQTAEKANGTAKTYRNIEAVVETLVINGKSGPPRVVAITTW